MRFEPVKTAIIGSGMISDIYLKNLIERFSITEVMACADMVGEKARAQAEKYNIRAMTVDQILHDPKIEMVLNLTYATSHYEISKAVLSAKKHCYSEKMMCKDIAQADELKKIADQNKVRFCVAPDTFLGASQQTARWLVDQGMIGKPLSVSAVLTRSYQLIKSDEDDMRRKFSVMYEQGGIPYDMGGYYLHQMFNLFGPVARVCGFMRTYGQDRPYLNPRNSHFTENFRVNTPNMIACAFEFRNGIYGTFMIGSDYQVMENSFKIYGTEGTLELGDPNNFGDKIYIEKTTGARAEFPLAHPFCEDYRGIGAADMAWGIRTGRPNRLSYEMGRHALEFIKSVEESAVNGKTVRLKTKFSRPIPISSEYYPGDSMERNLWLED